MCYFSIIYEVGGLICGAPAVLVVNQPMAFGDVHRKDHIAGYHDGGVIGVILVI